MLRSHPIQLRLSRHVAKHVNELFLAPVVELTPQTPQVFLDLAALSIETRAIIQQSLTVLELLD